MDHVGLIPAAGLATRLGPLPCSKEIYPLRFEGGKAFGASVPIEHLLGKFHNANVRRVFIVLREGKWDIPAFLGDGDRLSMHLAYLMMRVPLGQAFSVDAAYQYVRHSTVLFGSPDVLFDCDDAFTRLLERQSRSGADVVLGLFPARHPERVDMVDLDRKGGVRSILIKPKRTSLQYTWIIAVWTPVFTEFLHQEIGNRVRAGDAPAGPIGREVYVGDVVRGAIEQGVRVDSITFENACYVDIGSPDDLAEVTNLGFPAIDSWGDWGRQ